MQLQLYNDFHDTSANVTLADEPGVWSQVSDRAARAIRRRLCPSADCRCAEGPLGTRGPQAIEIEERPSGIYVRY